MDGDFSEAMTQGSLSPTAPPGGLQQQPWLYHVFRRQAWITSPPSLFSPPNNEKQRKTPNITLGDEAAGEEEQFFKKAKVLWVARLQDLTHRSKS